MKQRPLSVTIIGCLFVAVGIIGFAYHATDFKAPGGIRHEVVWVLVVRLLATFGGVFVLRGSNWARWLVLSWLAYHVILSAWHSMPELVTHGVLLAGVGYILFRAQSSAYFALRDDR